MLVNTAIVCNSSTVLSLCWFVFKPGMSHVAEDVVDKLALNRSLVFFFFPLLKHTPMNYKS